MAPCLAESCTMAPDGLSYAFTLRKGVLFHNGEALTAEDVKFSLERYRGASSKTLKERVAGVDIHDPHRLTIRLNEPWPDFLTFYAGATRRGLDRPQEIRPAGRRGRLQEGAGRRGTVQVRLLHPRRRAGVRGVRGLLAQAAGHQAAGLQGDPRRSDPAGRPAAQRDRHRLFDPRRAGRRAHAHARPDDQAGGGIGAVLAVLRRSVGCPVAVARPARAPGGQPRARPQDHQPGADARLFAPDGQHLPGEFRLLLAAAGRRSTIRRAPASCWPRPGMRGASMPGIITATPPTPISPRSC